MTAFELAPLQELRERASEAGRVPDDGPEGWSLSVVDPADVVLVFDSLRLSPAYKLCAYQYRERGNGNAFVYAIPAGSDVPHPDACPRKTGQFLAPPVPAGALDDFMMAVEGDQTPLSHFHASLLKRELHEFGALWHGCRWGAEQIVDRMPTGHRDGTCYDAETYPGPASPDYWVWKRSPPKRWAPVVTMGPTRIRVSFYTYGEVGREHIARHTDTYERGSHTSTTRTSVIAWGHSGIVF